MANYRDDRDYFGDWKITKPNGGLRTRLPPLDVPDNSRLGKILAAGEAAETRAMPAKEWINELKTSPAVQALQKEIIKKVASSVKGFYVDENGVIITDTSKRAADPVRAASRQQTQIEAPSTSARRPISFEEGE